MISFIMACELLESGFTFLYVNKSNCLKKKRVFFSLATNALNVVCLGLFLGGRVGNFQKML